MWFILDSIQHAIYYQPHSWKGACMSVCLFQFFFADKFIAISPVESVRVKHDQRYFWSILRFYDISIEQLLWNFVLVRFWRSMSGWLQMLLGTWSVIAKSEGRNDPSPVRRSNE